MFIIIYLCIYVDLNNLCNKNAHSFTSLRKNLPVPITKKNAHLSIWLLELIGILHPPFKAKETRNDGKRVRVKPPGFSPSFKAKFWRGYKLSYNSIKKNTVLLGPPWRNDQPPFEDVNDAFLVFLWKLVSGNF